MNYQRVCPRDLFNEGKLLKCLGKISIFIHDNYLPGLTLEEPEGQDGFKIYQTIDGDLFVLNLRFTDEEGEEVHFSLPYNSRDKWPLEMTYKDNTYCPINEKGEVQIDRNLFKGGAECLN